jgi:hypothetical protein
MMQSKRTTAAPATAAAADAAAAPANSPHVFRCIALLALAFETARITSPKSALSSRTHILMPAAAAACARMRSRFPSVLPSAREQSAALALCSERVKPAMSAAAADATCEAHAAWRAAAVGAWGSRERGRREMAQARVT